MAIIPASGLVAGSQATSSNGDEMPAVIASERTGKLRIVKRESYQAFDCALR